MTPLVAFVWTLQTPVHSKGEWTCCIYVLVQYCPYASKSLGAFHSTKIPVWISEIPCAQWNGTFRLHTPDPNHHTFGYCSRKQDSKERFWGHQFCQMEKNISVRPTEMTRPVKGPPSKLVPNIPVWPNWNGPCRLISNRNFRNLGWMESAPYLELTYPNWQRIIKFQTRIKLY